MGHHKLFYKDAKIVRHSLNEATDLADLILAHERELIRKLITIDRQRYFVRYGFRSLSGFCRDGLKLFKTQTQRIVTQVRRSESWPPVPMDNNVVKRPSNLSECGKNKVPQSAVTLSEIF